MTTLKTADEIRGVMHALKLDVVASYFDQDDDEIDPYVVCEGVSVDAFNQLETVKDCGFHFDFSALMMGADATFGPMGSTPNQTPAPAPRTIADWVTLAVEVGRSQSWASLKDAAKWWCGYAGIQYVLLLKISASGTQIRYALYDSTTRPTPTIRPTASETFRHNVAGAAVNVTFDMRRILSIPANQALLTGVNATAVVDLRTVMNLVIRSLG
ncbi:unnamed protein product [Phytophthora lilii]|uniref:Unnamed protein product n=1 Tax=Phytophthora lilii TaxID=2077276 RepID=A0A9W6X0Q2_9STRA|nr:unnamed protein product [Phytophthora lilii]